MGGIKSYDADNAKAKRATIKSDAERMIEYSKDFPNCKGLYPDCPDTPDLSNKMCRTCPKTEGMKKPRPPELDEDLPKKEEEQVTEQNVSSQEGQPTA